MALLRARPLRLRRWVTNIAVDWDQRVSRWCVEVRMEGGCVLRNWTASADGAAEQRREAELRRRPPDAPL